MNRFDRVTALLLMLQTRSVVTASFLSEHFDVTERTVYRDIRTLENAGVPIGSEAGVGYFLEKGYRLPPVSFTLDEAASLLLGEKLLSSSLDQNSHGDYKQALNKVRAVLDVSDKDYLSSLDADIEVLEINESAARQSDNDDRWLRECRSVLVRRQIVRIAYAANNVKDATSREIEPIGLFYYSRHWHMIAWCRLRDDYRDFRLDRIVEFEPLHEQFPRHSRETLQDYLARQRAEHELQEVTLLFKPEAARHVGGLRYMHGFIKEEHVDEGVMMYFMTSFPQFMARWLLQYTGGVRVIEGKGIQEDLTVLTKELSAHWCGAPSTPA